MVQGGSSESYCWLSATATLIRSRKVRSYSPARLAARRVSVACRYVSSSIRSIPYSSRMPIMSARVSASSRRWER